MQVGFRFKSQAGFFNRDLVIEAVDKATRKNMAKSGAMLRRVMQTSMRYGKKPSQAGEPPRAHREGRGPLLRKLLFFSYDPSTASVVVGPEKLPGAPGDAPRLQNEGGTVQRRVFVKKAGSRKATKAQAEAFKRLVRAGRIERAAKVTTAITLPARPYSVPALNKAKPKLAGIWADSVKP